MIAVRDGDVGRLGALARCLSATPVAVAAASTKLARAGLLVTRADALERLAQVNAVVLDKTGTLTSGGLSILRTTLLADTDKSESTGRRRCVGTCLQPSHRGRVPPVRSERRAGH